MKRIAPVAARPKLLRPKEVCEMLGVTAWELRTLRTSGRIPFHQLNRRVLRYSEADLLDFLQRTRANGRHAR